MGSGPIKNMSVDRKALDKCFESYCGLHNTIIHLSQQVCCLCSRLCASGRSSLYSGTVPSGAVAGDRQARNTYRFMLILINKVKKETSGNSWRICAEVRISPATGLRWSGISGIRDPHTIAHLAYGCYHREHLLRTCHASALHAHLCRA